VANAKTREVIMDQPIRWDAECQPGHEPRGPARPASATTPSCPVQRVIFSCPLCRRLGRVSTLVAELDPEPPLATVVDLEGCAHADGFGQLDKLTLEQEWELIEAALDAAIGETS
jgi:hypothetical protein